LSKLFVNPKTVVKRKGQLEFSDIVTIRYAVHPLFSVIQLAAIHVSILALRRLN